MTDQIQVPVVAPAFPLILADQKFLSTLAAVEAEVNSLKITDPQSAQLAADLQVRLTGAGKKLEATRVALKRPFLDINTAIETAAREPANRIERAKTVLKNAQIAWADEQDRIAEAAEAVRRAELARLEKIRLAEEAEAKRKTEELAKMAAEAAKKNEVPMLEIDYDDGPVEPPPKTETEKAIEAVKFAPAPVVQRPTGIAFRVRLVHRVESVAALPDTFVTKTANDAAIRATFCAGYREGEPLPTCPGVVFTVEKTPVDTGRRVF